MSRTTVVHCKLEPDSVYVGRGRGGRNMLTTPVGVQGWLGNPFGGPDAIERFRRMFYVRINMDDEFRQAVLALAGRKLGCWCKTPKNPDEPCHGDVIAEWLDSQTEAASDNA